MTMVSILVTVIWTPNYYPASKVIFRKIESSIFPNVFLYLSDHR